MPSTLFLQSEVLDPYSFYKEMTEEHPIYWDETNQIWAIYSYQYCTEILNNANMHIPALNQNSNLNQYASQIINNLVRLSNDLQHEIAKEISIILFSNMKSININTIMEELLQNGFTQNKIDWVDSVCKKLPVLVILKSFDYNKEDCNFISEKITQLVRIMLPNKTIEDIESINNISEDIYLITAKHISKLSFYESLLKKISAAYNISLDKTISMFVSNLIGLLIQSYDAGRGLLSNSLLQILSKEDLISKNNNDKMWIQNSVIETLRFDPPIHNTRRIATADIKLNGTVIKKNDSILIVLASANRDPMKFNNSMNFNIERINNNEHLTFGTGGHMCLAKYFSVSLATEALWYLFGTYKTITILENDIRYEPMINARLPKNIWISLL